MKIIHLISGGDVGGAKTHVLSLLSGLKEHHKIQLVCFMEGAFAQEARELGIPTMVLTDGVRTSLGVLSRLIREQGYEVVHCHGARANMFGSMLKSRLDIPVVTTVHSDYRLDYLGRPAAALTYGTINRFALRRLDDWIGVADTTSDMLIRRGFDPERVFTIYNGVPFDAEAPTLSRGEYLKKFGVSADENTAVFGIAARIDPVKDIQTLLRAFSQAVKDCPNIRLLIAGDGEQRQELEAMAGELCPSGTVTFVGWQEDMRSFYNALDVNMLTSLSEGFPYALVEGARQRCATISTRVGGVPALVEHEINGFLFQPRDVQALTEYILRCARQPELRKEFGRRLYEKAKREFSLEATVERQLEIYRTILRRRKRQAERPRDGVMICGAYGRGNGGDDTILSAIVGQLREMDSDLPICVITRNPVETALENHVRGIYTFRALKLRRQMKKTRLYLSGGGSLIQDATSSRSLWYYLSSIRSAKRCGNQVMMFGCGIGPVSHALNRRHTAKTINRCVDAITLRDAESLRELERLGVKDVPVRLTADMAFLARRAPESEQRVYHKACGLEKQGNYLMFAPRPWPGAETCVPAFAQAALYAEKKYGLTPVVYAMEPGRDRELCEKIARQIQKEGGSCLLLSAPKDSRLILGLVGRMRAVIAMRLHGLILAATQGVAFAGVAYDPKVSGFMDYIGQGACCTLEQLSADTLKGLIDVALEEKNCADSAARMQKLAQENCRIAMELYAGNEPDMTRQIS
ncbi:MAG: polysaccharide pyruvyl transferase CsaB [Faecousia sp.]